MTFTGAALSPNVSSNNSSATKVVIPNKNVSESRGITPFPIYRLYIFSHRICFNIISSQDVLFGTGRGTNNYPGNKHYRSLVNAQKSTYLAAKSSKNKRAIAKSIMQQLNNLHPPGRFLIEDRSGLGHISSTANDANDYSHPLVRNKVWVQVSDDLAIDKIMHSLREKEKKTSGNNNADNQTNSDSGVRPGGSGRGTVSFQNVHF